MDTSKNHSHHVALWLTAAVLLILFACSRHRPEQIAGAAARQYYEQMLAGNYEAFVDGTWQPEAIPEGYRSQLIDNAAMFADRLQKEHRGVREGRIAEARLDTLNAAQAEVFLVFCFGDSTTEEVLVPMVCHDNTWYLR